MAEATERVLAAVRQRSIGRDQPLLVAIDGRSGAGKSTLAASVATELGAVVIPGDDFYAAEVTDAGWDARSPAQRATDAIDWRRLRREALEPLLTGRAAAWCPFDFEGVRPDGSYPSADRIETREPSGVIVVEGAYSSRPELADLINLAVLVEVPAAARRQRLGAREDPDFLQAWHARWDPAEDYYFGQVRPPDSFDLVIHPD